ncbi:phage portal protein [Mycolicibacterium rhodesiae]|uniref:Phage portal protein n=1 Tax=Mycolicibacterium rhodesiae TaxID=36814 RepID=A0A1X0J780_MYCRH|nr:phage portal protein [Mycolicibacterium rhodesiae]
MLRRAFQRPPDPPAPAEQRNYSIADPRVVELFGGNRSLTGVNVSEHNMMGVAAVWRCVHIIAGGIATLPLRAIREHNGITERVPSWLDNPAGGLTRFELIQTTVAHLLLWGNAYLAHVYGGAGQLMGVSPIHPSAVGIDVDDQGRKSYRVSLLNGTTEMFTDATLTHIKGVSTDGICGLSPLQLARNGAFGTALAADQGAANFHGHGPTISAIASFDESTTKDDAKELAAQIDGGLTGPANAGRIGFINRNIQIHPFMVSNEDSQWLESRAFQKSEIATWFGVPDSLVGLSEKQSSWGTGIAEMHKAMASWTFKLWSSPLEDRLSLILPPAVRAEFDYRALLSPAPEAEIGLLIAQVGAGLMSTNEARRVLNLPPIADATTTTPEVPQ